MTTAKVRDLRNSRSNVVERTLHVLTRLSTCLNEHNVIFPAQFNTRYLTGDISSWLSQNYNAGILKW